MQLKLRSAQGTEIGAKSLDIEAGHQRAFIIEEVFPEVLEMSDQTFQLEVSSDRSVFGTTVFYDRYGTWQTVNFEAVQ